jgi:hypothetical protein
MRRNTISREILLVTASSFAQREFCEKDSAETTNNLSYAEQLEIACWNGLFIELFPEIMNESPNEEKIYLWEVVMSDSYLKLSLGSCNPEFEKIFTIDPSEFLTEKELN